jgi:hypothetical protein
MNETRREIFKHGTKILRAIAEHYDLGAIENPEQNHMLMQVFALAIDGKIRANVCEDTDRVLWSLTDTTRDEVEKMKQGIADKVIVKGPW